MNWYAAHVILYFKKKNRKQKSFRVWENIVLIRARDDEEAFDKAEKRGKEELLGNDDSLTWGGHPAEIVFAGVRKVTLCVEPEDRPTDGTEITYIEMDLKSEQAIQKLVGMQPVSVEIVDRLPDEEPEPSGNGKRTREPAMK